MKKGALALLLIFPFLISFLAFATSDYLIKRVEQDIVDIEIAYASLEPFGLKQGKTKLEAKAVYNEDYPLGEGNALVFSVPKDQSIARIDHESDGYYFVPLSEGQVEVTVSNTKGNVAKRFTALVYGEAGNLVFNLDRPFSSSGIGKRKYWGLYDLSYDSLSSPYYKHLAAIDFSYYVVGNEAMDVYDFSLEHSDNLSIDLSRGEITVLGTGESYVRFTHPFSTSAEPVEISFEVVEAVNVYSYSDLIKATNLSETGEAVALHVNLDSKANYDKLSDKSGTEVFGEVDGKVDPESYVYEFETTYNHDFATWWNESEKTTYDIRTTLHAGIRLRQSLYGNGFLINGHDLCFASEVTELSGGDFVPNLQPGDLFRGPLVYASAGNPYTPYGDAINGVEPLLVIYGQDNVLLYADGDGIVIDDLRLRNADFGNNYENLFCTGTGIEVSGERVIITNSSISSARTLVRSYSSDLSLTNCLLQNCLEFGLRTGANESNGVDYSKRVEYVGADGKPAESLNGEYLQSIDLTKPIGEQLRSGRADAALTNGIMYHNQTNVFVGGMLGLSVERDIMDYDDLLASAQTVQNALTNDDGFVRRDGEKEYFNEATVEDCFFYNCHIAPIAVDSYPNGPFFESTISTMFAVLLGIYMDDIPSGMARTMAPSLLTLSGDNRFYTYQEVDELSFGSLLYDDINSFISAHGGVSIKPDVDEDDYLPLRGMLSSSDSVYQAYDGASYIATPIMKMGGGSNLSDVQIGGELADSLRVQSLNCYQETLLRDAYMVADDRFMDSDKAMYSTMVVALSRAASNVLGFENYVFYCYDPEQAPYFGETPSLSELSGRAA